MLQAHRLLGLLIGTYTHIPNVSYIQIQLVVVVLIFEKVLERLNTFVDLLHVLYSVKHYYKLTFPFYVVTLQLLSAGSLDIWTC